MERPEDYTRYPLMESTRRSPDKVALAVAVTFLAVPLALLYTATKHSGIQRLIPKIRIHQPQSNQ